MPPLKKILLVDDQRVMRSIAEFSLGKIGGFTLRVCASGEEALEEAAAFAPDLLLLDVNMPDLNGMQTLERLRARGIQTPAVFFTVNAAAVDMARLGGMEALGVIAKPFDPLKLPGQLKELWSEHHRGR